MRGEGGEGEGMRDEKVRGWREFETVMIKNCRPKVCVLSDQWAAPFSSWTGNEVRLIQTSLQ